ncbi:MULTISPECIES: nitrogenase iron-molybdenum cofactor biosynthesis protein NifN [Paenibacillus]|uniref:Nitrogenase iron-molybdenum cofactor biosynthesis protein NifN n=2 Tax=Paenibacillus TaxID=44249 RepID=A0ABX2ZGX8_PAEPO|nr:MULTISPECIES: nitrogenase iron-molybdenum cofactor biosynthesis protein NifN [Paenibacillus]AHC18649.1 nitrogenase iron-molybdenum cofactor biosynthesis protein NifN [Paenibacillus polymyxa CR1]MDR6777390.1 nitrogenase molybdenum-iron protein NifN [Paenibacillus peoriae]ODA10996.1 nitrogenase iron-molybdenum cofactor biosynthesis protein NifN [Paenibacillus polymyxa]OME70333.1 nitrogenase iron-molybdenum cofactor biosynthesis protein NifN [Paenibacillus peoriae]OMF34311.1 nitrogenase iron-m
MPIKSATKPVSVNPLKVGQPLGGVLALQGMYRSMPLLHGAQGCSAFSKALLTRHFREPIAVQTSALQEMDVIFDADRNLEEALDHIWSKHHPDVIGVISTALTEVAGVDFQSRVKAFKRERALKESLLFSVSLPDFHGSLETGYSSTVESLMDAILGLAGGKSPKKQRRTQVNLLPASYLTAGDVMEIKDIIASFGLEVITLPDISTSLSGHLLTGFSPLTRGGTPLDSACQMLESSCTIAIGASMERPARRLTHAAGIPYHLFTGLSGLAASDAFIHFLQKISREPAPVRFRWQRENLLDSMLDAHFYYSGASAVVALEPDHMLSTAAWLEEMGVELKRLITPCSTPALQKTEREVWIGDLDDAEESAQGVDLWISNSHGRKGAARAGASFVPAGLPVYDELGAHTSVSVGYRGTMEWVNKVGNVLLAERGRGG